MKGAVYVALGNNALREVELSVKSLQGYSRYPIRILKSPFPGSAHYTVDQQAHWAKVNVNNWTPFDPTLLLDADTRIKGDLSFGFELLRKGWELVMVPSFPTSSGQVLWSLAEHERRATFQDLGTWRHIMLNTGVMFFRKTANVASLFQAWREEWLRFEDRDQGAFLRALVNHPVRLWLLGAPYNSAGGELVDHLFGRAKT